MIRIDEPKDEHEIPPCILLRFKALIDGEWRDCGCPADSDKVEPIPITEELLTELGFEYKDKINRWRKVLAGLSFIDLTELPDGLWRMETVDDTYVRGCVILRYLHELEQILYLTTKTELIKE